VSLELNVNEYIITPDSQTDETMFNSIVESVTDTIASFNSIFQERAINGEVMSSRTELDNIPTAKILTPRQKGVIKVSVWELWQTGLVQSLIQGRPIVYDEPEFSSDPKNVDIRMQSDQNKHISLIYFGDEFDICTSNNDTKIRFHHNNQSIRPVGKIDTEVDVEPLILGIELRYYTDCETLTATLLNNTPDNSLTNTTTETRSGLKPDTKSELDEITERLYHVDTISDEDGAEAFNDTIQFIRDHGGESHEDVAGLPDIINHILIERGVVKTAELNTNKCLIQEHISNLLGNNIYHVKNNHLKSIIYKDVDEKWLRSLDNALFYTNEESRIDRLVGWMLNYPEESIDYSAGVEIASEKSSIETVNELVRESIDPNDVKYLLLLPYPFNAESETAIKREIRRGKTIAETVKEFDEEYNTTAYENALIPVWSFRGNVDSIDCFHASFNNTAMEPSFWRI